MRILFISNFYPPYDLGGWEQNCQEIVQRFQQRGHTCHVLTSCYGVQSQSLPEADVTRALYLEADVHYYRPFEFFFRYSEQEQANRRVLHQAIATFRPDVIFIWGMWNLSAQVAYWAEQWLPGRVAYAVASYWLLEPNMHTAYWQQPGRHWWSSLLMSPLRRWALQVLARERRMYPLTLEHVAYVSEFVYQKHLAANVLPHNARVIYNGIDPEPFVKVHQLGVSRKRDVLQLIYVGGILPHKGVHTAIEALGILREQGACDGLHLTLVGSGHPDYETRLKARVAALSLHDRVTFYGRVPREEISLLLSSADVFLFTSIWDEPIARTVMEAMASALAVIATAVGGQNEMLEDGINALIFAPDDAQQLADCIRRLQRDPALRQQLANAGRQVVLERFTLVRMVDEMESWLEGIIA